MLIVSVPASNRDLVRIDDVRTQLNIVDGSEDDNLALWIQQASAAVERYENRIYAKETVEQTERRDGCSLSGIVLERFPVTDVMAVTEDGTALGTDEYERDGSILYRVRGGDRSYWSSGKIVIVYMAGFDIDDIPGNVKRAVIITVNHYRLGTDRDPQLRSEVVDGAGSSSYFDGLDKCGLSPEARGLLSRNYVIG